MSILGVLLDSVDHPFQRGIRRNMLINIVEIIKIVMTTLC